MASKTVHTDQPAEIEAPPETKSCFVIMPISDQTGYQEGHFTEVYESIIAPAATSCGYDPIRADQVSATNLIHLDILKRIIEAPLAICDLSAANPNVMFELGIRQAFDRPVVLIKDSQTRKIFDIDTIRTIHYDVGLRPRSVKSTIEALCESIKATTDAKPNEGLNSIVGLLGLHAAALKRNDEDPTSARVSILETTIESVNTAVRDIGIKLDRLDFSSRSTGSALLPTIAAGSITADDVLKSHHAAQVKSSKVITREELDKRLKELLGEDYVPHVGVRIQSKKS